MCELMKNAHLFAFEFVNEFFLQFIRARGQNAPDTRKRFPGSFPFVPQYVMRPPPPQLQAHVPLYSKSLYENMARASGGSK